MEKTFGGILAGCEINDAAKRAPMPNNHTPQKDVIGTLWKSKGTRRKETQKKD